MTGKFEYFSPEDEGQRNELIQLGISFAATHRAFRAERDALSLKMYMGAESIRTVMGTRLQELQQLAVELEGRPVRGYYSAARFYVDSHSGFKKLEKPFNDFRGESYSRRFRGVLEGIELIQGMESVDSTDTTEHYAYVVGSLSTMDEEKAGDERAYYMRNTSLNWFENPFGENWNRREHLYLPIGSVAEIEIDGGYLNRVETHARFAAKIAGLQPPEGQQ